MRIILTIYGVLGCIVIGMAQSLICAPATDTFTFSPNNIETTLGHGGTIWYKKYGFGPMSSTSPSVLNVGTLWICGRDPGGNTSINAEKFDFLQGLSDYSPGPGHQILDVDTSLCSFFDRHWYITREDIESFKTDFNDNGVLNEDHLPLWKWPAIGNPAFYSLYGVNLPLQPIAPFFDNDGDGLYDPAHGDYPAIKGDEAVWWVINSFNQYPHVVPSARPVGFEIRIMAYGYHSDDPVLSNTTFYELTLLNNGNLEDVLDVYTGLFFDVNIGCPDDDYVGCLPEKRLAFAYNADAVDGEPDCSCPEDVATFCDDIPVFGVQLLDDFGSNSNDSMSFGVFSVTTESGLPGVSPPVGMDPITPSQYHYLSNGTWDLTHHFTFGDNGYQTGGEITSYLYPDLPSDPNGWSMCTANRPPDDYRMLFSVGPHDFQVGSVRQMAFALHLVNVSGYPCPDLTPLVNAADQVQEFYDATITSTRNLVLPPGALTAYPNPAAQSFRVAISMPDDFMTGIKVLNIQGQQLRRYEIQNEKEFEITRNGLPSGLYFIRVQTENGQVGIQKIVFE